MAFAFENDKSKRPIGLVYQENSTVSVGSTTTSLQVDTQVHPEYEYGILYVDVSLARSNQCDVMVHTAIPMRALVIPLAPSPSGGLFRYIELSYNTNDDDYDYGIVKIYYDNTNKYVSVDLITGANHQNAHILSVNVVNV